MAIVIVVNPIILCMSVKVLELLGVALLQNSHASVSSEPFPEGRVQFPPVT